VLQTGTVFEIPLIPPSERCHGRTLRNMIPDRKLCSAAPTTPFDERDRPPLIVVGITHPQTCMVLGPRLRALKEGGFRVVLISSPGELLDQMVEEEGVEAVPIPMCRDIAPLSDLVSLIRLSRALARLRPDMTEFSTPKAGLLGNLAARWCGVPVRVYMLRGLRLETLAGLKRRVLVWAERIASACARHVVCNSRSLRAMAIALRLAPAQKLHLIGSGSSNGVDIDRFSPGPDLIRRRLGILPPAPVIGFVGRLTRDKGIPELIDAFDEVLHSIPSARLLLVGWFDRSEDAVSEPLKRRILAHPRIVCTGYVKDTAPYYRAMDVMALPTWREGFPNVVLEAAASGVPVVTTISTGSRDAVIPEVTGLLIPAGYPQAIAESLLRLLRHPEDRVRMGRAARTWVIERFVNGRVLGLTVSFYRTLLARAGVEKNTALTTDAPAVGD
jgi:glycosyltransferase involved in cell wall biosynthesis